MKIRNPEKRVADARKRGYEVEVRIPQLQTWPPHVVDAHINDAYRCEPGTHVQFISIPFPDHTRVWLFRSLKHADAFFDLICGLPPDPYRSL